VIAPARLRPSLPGAFRGEVLKVSRQLSVWLMILAGFGVLAIIVLASSTAGPFKGDLQHNPSAFMNDAVQIYGTVFQIGSGVVLLIVSARLIGMEYSSGTIRVLYARGIGRLQLLIVKMSALVVFGLLLLAGYLALVTLIILGFAQVWGGGPGALSQVSATEWTNVERAIGFYAANVVVLVLVAAAAAGLGRSLSFALPAALALFPADNFASIILALVARVTQHDHPWLDVNQWFLGPNLNALLPLWLTTHPRPAFATPLVHVDLTHVVALIFAWSLGLAAIAVARCVVPDVLE
jgi:hypothetical protein